MRQLNSEHCQAEEVETPDGPRVAPLCLISSAELRAGEQST